MKKLAAVGMLGLAGGAAWYYAPASMSPTEAADRFADSTFLVHRDDLRITITENGYLKSKNSESLQPAFRGSGKITWLIDEGTSVEEGDVLVKFDDSDNQTRLDQAKTNLLQFETELEAARADLDIASRENEAAIEKAELDVEIARLTLQRYEQGEHPNTVRKNALALEKAQSEYERAKERFEQVPQLHEEGFLTSIQVEEERIRLREAEINLENAQKDVELYNSYTRPMELKQKEAALRDAERTLETARQRADINLKEKQARVTRYEARVTATEKQIAEIEKDIEAMQLKAPRPGLVLYGDPRQPWRHDDIKVGAEAYSGWTIITLPDLSEMQVMVEVHEADVDKVAVGQKAVITLDTYPGRIFTGKVTNIASVAQSSDWGDDTNKQFPVEITLDPFDIQLRAGITAKVEIEIETVENALIVPVHAVFKEGDEYFCFQPNGKGGFERSTVTIGSNNEHYVAIEDGLEEGDPVLLYDPRQEGLVESGRSLEPDDVEEADATSIAPAEE